MKFLKHLSSSGYWGWHSVYFSYYFNSLLIQVTLIKCSDLKLLFSAHFKYLSVWFGVWPFVIPHGSNSLLLDQKTIQKYERYQWKPLSMYSRSVKPVSNLGHWVTSQSVKIAVESLITDIIDTTQHLLWWCSGASSQWKHLESLNYF